MLLQALSSAVQPRALWLAAHHYELAPTLDPGWAHLLQGLSTSLGVHDDDAKTRRCLYLSACLSNCGGVAGGCRFSSRYSSITHMGEWTCFVLVTACSVNAH